LASKLHFDATAELTRGCVAMAACRLAKQLPSLGARPALFRHVIDEALAFEGEFIGVVVVVVVATAATPT
jgi:hypothetical protein